MASAIFDRNHVATTPDEKAIERGFASSVGFLGGVGFTLASCVVTGTLPLLWNPAVFLTFATSIPLGIIAANKYLTSEAPELPVLEMMRYSMVALPLVLMTEVLLGGHALGLLGDFVGSAPMIGARFLLALLTAGAAHAIANLSIWDEAPEEPIAPSVDWQKRYVEARSRLAHTAVETRRSRESEEAELAEFDRRLAQAMAANTDEQVVLATVEERVTATA